MKTLEQIVAETKCTFSNQFGGGRLLAQQGRFGLVATTYSQGKETVLLIVEQDGDKAYTFLRPKPVRPWKINAYVKEMNRIMLRLDEMVEGGWKSVNLYQDKNWGRLWYGRMVNDAGLKIDSFNCVAPATSKGNRFTTGALRRYRRQLYRVDTKAAVSGLKNEKALTKAEQKLKSTRSQGRNISSVVLEMFPDLEVDETVKLLEEAQVQLEQAHAMSMRDIVALAAQKTGVQTVTR